MTHPGTMLPYLTITVLTKDLPHRLPRSRESGYVLGGTGWYRKAFTLSGDMRDKVISVDFDGVYMNATVYINGVKLGTHPYGYTSFSFVLPNEHLKFGGEENVISVKVEHRDHSRRQGAVLCDH